MLLQPLLYVPDPGQILYRFSLAKIVVGAPGDAERLRLRERLANLVEPLTLFDEIYRVPTNLTYAARMVFLWLDAGYHEEALDAGGTAEELLEAQVDLAACTIGPMPGLDDYIEKGPAGLTFERVINDLARAHSGGWSN